MAGMNMSKAFNSKMLTKLIKIENQPGSYDDNNVWVEGRSSTKNIWGVLLSGNRFTQFEEGISLKNLDGGSRYPNYKSLHLSDKYVLDMNDKVKVKGKIMNVLQKSDEDEYGFTGYLLEESDKDN